ncbi:pyridoxal phosphate-dependent transferase [Papiliotrema laurentii]|uniref:Pyridoxal phosphate-dependent transferase n=1 Tax=Papiliotrema laurentii TaxID=5418 RepID=A0AAD9CXI0_PAPLA|nr:pyridoxal phosphate-dependent transferase [Papiliotrema laurentii]
MPLAYAISAAVAATDAPPIPKARAWAQEYLASSPSKPLLDLSQGVPRDPPHPDFVSALAETSKDPSASRYGPILGEPALREAYATETNVLYRLPDQAITAREVGLTTGCNMAFLTVVMAICPPQTSSILVPLPAYFNYSMTLSLQSVKPVYLPSDPSNGFVPDLAAARSYLESDAARGQVRPRFILLTSPSNPTGTICPDAHLKRWYDLAREFSIALVIDETYREFVEPEDGGSGLGVPHRLFREPDWRDTVISLSSFSKGYRIPGHRLGSIIASPDLLQHITTICDCMQICPPRPPQLALAPLLPSLRSDLVSASRTLASRRQLFKTIVEAVPGWTVAASGGFYAYVSFPSDYLHASSALGLKRKRLGSEDIAKVLAKKCGVTVLPGAFFMPSTGDDEAWNEVVGGENLREDRWLRFAVANVEDNDVRQLGERLSQLNEIMGMA